MKNSTEMTIREVCNAIEDGSITFEDEITECDNCEGFESELKQDPIYLGNGLYCQSCIEKHLETLEDADEEFIQDMNTGEWHKG